MDEQLKALAQEFLIQAGKDPDYTGLWEIVGTVRHRFKISDDLKARSATLGVVRHLLMLGLWPGDYTNAGFTYWKEDRPELVMARIEKEWISKGKDPNLAEPICWFGLKKTNGSGRGRT